MRRLPLFAAACLLSFAFGAFADEDATQTLVFSEPPAPPAGQYEYLQAASFLPDGTLLSVSCHEPIPEYSDLDNLIEGGGCGRNTPIGPDFVSLWEPSSGKRLVTTQTADLEEIKVAPDGHTLTDFAKPPRCHTGHRPGIRLFDLRDMSRPARLLRGVGDSLIDQVEFSPDSQSLYVAGNEIHLSQWSLQTGRQRWSLKERLDGSVFALSPDDSLAFAAFSDHSNADQLALVSAKTGRTLHRLKIEGEVDRVESLAFSPEGKFAVALLKLKAGKDTQAVRYIWNAKTGEPVAQFPAESALPPEMEYVDSELLACKTISIGRQVQTQDKQSKQQTTTLTYFETETGNPLQRVEINTLKLGRVLGYSADGRYVALGSSVRGLAMLDTSAGTYVQLMPSLPRKTQGSLSAWWQANHKTQAKPQPSKGLVRKLLHPFSAK